MRKIGVSTITLLKDEMFFRMAMKFGSTLHWNLGYQCYNPYEQFEQWYQYDMDHGYNSSGLLMRLAQTSSQFTDNENAYEIEKAINKIVANDPANIYKKLKIEIKDDTGYAQSA